MPKVNDAYRVHKRSQILDAAYKVTMNKPVYDISMSDVIKESGLSQGGIYRYYSNLDDILIGLINRECSADNMEAMVEGIVNQKAPPEKVLFDLFGLWKDAIFLNLISVGKIYFELVALYANKHDKLYRFRSEINLCKQEAIFQEKSFLWIDAQVKAECFHPKITLADLMIFMATGFDGIIRDMILVRQYQAAEVFPGMAGLNADRMISNMYLAVLLLLGGNAEHFISGGYACEDR